MEAKTANVLQRSQDETMLIGLILDGQTNLFRQLASQYAERVLQLVSRMITSPEDAEEVTQDALLAAFQSLRRFDAQQASFPTWLSAIAYRTALKYLRDQQKVLFVETDQTWLDSFPDNEADMLLNDTRPDRLVFLDQAVSQLRPDDQMLLSFYYYDDKPIREISYITGRTEGYLRSRLQWIRKRMALTIKTLEADEKE
jgi:RNA polymerase sigma-70 factor (ECF subfamily)